MMRICCVSILLLAALTLPVLAVEPPPEPKLVMSAQADLNGDGAVEAIALVSGKETFTLTVGNVVYTGKLDQDIPETATGFQVIDLDTTDKLREVAVRLAGASSETCQVFGFDGAKVSRMGEFAQWPSFPGNGMVYERAWMGFWLRLDKYQLDAKARTFRPVPQPFYYVGVSGTVKKRLPIYRAQARKEVVANLQPNSAVLLLLNQGDWYLVKSTSGLTGWLPADQITADNFADVPWGG